MENKIIRKVIISYPFGGFEDQVSFKKYFIDILNTAKTYDRDGEPIVIFNMDTDKREEYAGYLEKDERKEFKIVKMMSTDTCVMWLRGWEEAIKYADNKDLNKKNVRVILLPGDIQIETDDSRQDFIKKLNEFCCANDKDLILGDYDVGTDSAKELIDKHGTYPFLAIWFPEFYEFLYKEKIKRPRSEFLNIKLPLLKELIIGPRKFSYEQTIILLYRSFKENHSISKMELGKVTDEKGFRAMLGVMEQIERMERMLRLFWRDEQRMAIEKKYELTEIPRKILSEKLIEPYELLDRRSNLIRQSSIITIKAMLDRAKKKKQ